MAEDKPPAPEHREPLRSQYADDPEMADILEMFVREMPQRLEALTEAWKRRELEALRHMVHQIKGASGLYGYPSIGQAAQDLERTLRQLVERGAAVGPPQLQSEFNRLLELCRSMSVR